MDIQYQINDIKTLLDQAETNYQHSMAAGNWGNIPKNVIKKSSRKSEFFNKKNRLKDIDTIDHESIKDKIKCYNDMDEDKLEIVTSFINQCLSLDYTKRPNTENLLKHEFLN